MSKGLWIILLPSPTILVGYLVSTWELYEMCSHSWRLFSPKSYLLFERQSDSERGIILSGGRKRENFYLLFFPQISRKVRLGLGWQQSKNSICVFPPGPQIRGTSHVVSQVFPQEAAWRDPSSWNLKLRTHALDVYFKQCLNPLCHIFFPVYDFGPRESFSVNIESL